MTFGFLAVGCLVALPVVVVLKRRADAKHEAREAKRHRDRRRRDVLRGLHSAPAPDVSALPGFWSENLERRRVQRPPLPQLDNDEELGI